MTKAPKNSTPTDDELRDELRYWPEWIDWDKAQEHVADNGPVPTHSTRAEHTENILRQRTAAEALRRRVISGDIEYQSERGDLTLEDFRAATLSEYMCKLYIGKLGLAIDNYKVCLRRAHVYRFFPTRWMGAEGKARLEPAAAPSATKPRSAPTAEHRVEAERHKDKLEPKVKLGSKAKKVADVVLALTRQGRTWGWSERDALLTEVRELSGYKSLHISTLKRALSYLRGQGLMTTKGIAITAKGIAALDQVGSEPK
jgi:hypothetical protein